MRHRSIPVLAVCAVIAAVAALPAAASGGHCAALLKQIALGPHTARSLTTFIDDACASPTSSVGLGAHLVGRSGSTTVSVTNTTGSPESVSAVVLAGADPTAFAIGSDTCSGVTLADGASCDVGVTFTPTEGRTYSAVLGVADDGADSPHLTALSGDGPVAPTSFHVQAAPTFLPPTEWGAIQIWPAITYTYVPNDSPVTVTATDGNGLPLDLASASVHLTSDCPLSAAGASDYTFAFGDGSTHTFSISLGDVPSFSADCTVRAVDPAGVIGDGEAVVHVAGELCDDVDNNGNGAADELYPQVPVTAVDPFGGRNDNPHAASPVTFTLPDGSIVTRAWACSADGMSVVPWP